ALGRVGGRRSRRLGEAVTLVDLHARAREEQAEPAVHRGAARDGVADAAAHRGPELGVDELVEQLVLHAQTRRVAGTDAPGRRLVALLGVEYRLHVLGDRVRLVHEAGVCDDTALRAAGGARGVDDRRGGVGGDRLAVPVHHVVVDVRAGVVELLHGVVVQLPQ